MSSYWRWRWSELILLRSPSFSMFLTIIGFCLGASVARLPLMPSWRGQGPLYLPCLLCPATSLMCPVKEPLYVADVVLWYDSFSFSVFSLILLSFLTLTIFSTRSGTARNVAIQTLRTVPVYPTKAEFLLPCGWLKVMFNPLVKSALIRDFRLPPPNKWELRSSWFLCSE